MKSINLSEILATVSGKFRCVAPFIVRGNNILIGHRHYSSGSLWTTPGGKCEIYETFEESVRREVLEEVGITDLGIVEYLGNVTGATGDNLLSIFICETNEEPRLMEPEKFSEWKWCDIDEIPENFINPPALELARKYICT